ncbi:MAG: hypothetical protein HC847_25095 [Hydrococcus sp. RU_2_2]|jgi:hypothetical protein|nr:hypothetical protein [Hydrococcus sp. RU_2_2]NJP19847.1 hypothetical protein [Hydrococcus sp. CRU_1_1]NJQ96755.1 hypothetical protein [Hydrococcus sp. CSU_1_8]
MSSKTFRLGIKNGTLVIPQEVTQYLHQCQEAVEISLTIQSSEPTTVPPSSSSDNSEKDLQASWERWFEEVEQLEPEPPKSEPDEYGKALIEKYRKQGLEL